MLFFIDYENCHSPGLKGARYLLENDTIYLFYSINANKMPYECIEDIARSGCGFETFRLEHAGKNAMDMYLAVKIGSLLEQKRDENFAIISGDMGFLSIADYCRKYTSLKYPVRIAANIEDALTMGPDGTKRGIYISQARKTYAIDRVEEVVRGRQRELGRLGKEDREARGKGATEAFQTGREDEMERGKNMEEKSVTPPSTPPRHRNRYEDVPDNEEYLQARPDVSHPHKRRPEPARTGRGLSRQTTYISNQILAAMRSSASAGYGDGRDIDDSFLDDDLTVEDCMGMMPDIPGSYHLSREQAKAAEDAAFCDEDIPEISMEKPKETFVPDELIRLASMLIDEDAEKAPEDMPETGEDDMDIGGPDFSEFPEDLGFLHEQPELLKHEAEEEKSADAAVKSPDPEEILANTDNAKEPSPEATLFFDPEEWREKVEEFIREYTGGQIYAKFLHFFGRETGRKLYPFFRDKIREECAGRETTEEK